MAISECFCYRTTCLTGNVVDIMYHVGLNTSHNQFVWSQTVVYDYMFILSLPFRKLSIYTLHGFVCEYTYFCYRQQFLNFLSL